MTDDAQSPELDLTQAITIANREAFMIGHPYIAAAFKSDGDPMVTLRITRMIGGVAREFSMGLQLRRSEVEFCEMSRKVWALLLAMAEESREQPKPATAEVTSELRSVRR